MNPLSKASMTAQAVLSYINEANASATPVECLVLMQIYADAAKLTNQIDALIFALAAK